MRSGLFIVREGRSSMALYDGATLIGTGRTAYLHPIAERIARERGWSKPVIAPDVSMGRVLRAWVPERNAAAGQHSTLLDRLQRKLKQAAVAAHVEVDHGPAVVRTFVLTRRGVIAR